MSLHWTRRHDARPPAANAASQVNYAVYNYADIPVSFNGTEREIFDQKWFDFQNDLAAAGIDVRAVETF
jgi:hypothetical protein